MELLLILSQEHETLPKAEVKAVLEALKVPSRIEWEYNGILIVKVDQMDLKTLKIIETRLSFVHEVCELLLRTDRVNLSLKVKEYLWEDVINQDFAVRVKRIDVRKNFDSQATEWEIGGIIKDKLGDKVKVNLEDPSTFLRTVVTCNEVFIGKRLIKIAKKHFFDLKPHKRPFFNPGSMNPKLARCMVNLSRIKDGELVLDPFCGTGGILIEAGIIGAKLIGIDINEEMVKGTIENLKFCGIKDYEVCQGNARDLEINDKVDAIVTDPPYGISASTAGEESKKIYEESLSSMHKIVKDGRYICIATPHYLDFHKLVNFKKFEIIEQHEIRMHKSLTRLISVLKKYGTN